MKIVVKNREGERIDRYLVDEVTYSRSTINKMLDLGYILINHQVVKPSYKVKLEDEIEIVQELKEESHLEPVSMSLDILYEDQDIMVINKPSGLVVHPGNGNPSNTLANGLLYYTNSLSDVNGEKRPGIVHRLDKDTSGVMLVAKSNQAHQILSDCFTRHEVKREYIALLNGVFPHAQAKIDAPIGRDEKDRKKMAVTSKHSKQAITYLKVLQRFENSTLVSLNLETGRTHQIRVHMHYIGYSVFNDPVYGHQVLKDYGQFLHSRTIDFIHPITQEKMHFEAPLPDYFQTYLEKLK